MLLFMIFFPPASFGVATAADYSAPSIFLNNQPLSFDAPPVVENGRTLVPLRVVSESLGATVLWDESVEAVTVVKGSTAIQLVIGGRTYKNGILVEIDVPAKIINGRTMVPLRFVGESLGCSVIWHGETRKVEIFSTDVVIERNNDRMAQEKNQIDQEIVTLAKSIAEGKKTDMEKVRAVHDWVAGNISYDVELYGKGEITSEMVDPVQVLRKRKSVCSGYSALTEKLLEALGIPARTVNGWGRWYYESWEETFKRSPEGNHAWNEAFVDGRWIAMDVTWDAGYVDMKVMTFTRELEYKYFDPDPKLFADNHRKSDEKTR